MTKCPTPQEIQKFVAGDRDGQEAAVIASHLQECPVCQQAVAALSTRQRDNTPKAEAPSTVNNEFGVANFLRRLTEDTPAPSESTSAPTPVQSFGRYQLVRQLGSGGMGSVWLAHDRELDRSVAIKVPRLDPFDTTGRERFRQEGRAAARLEHPNIARVYEVGEVEGTPYLAMEYVPGQTLAEKLSAKPVSVQEAVRLAIAIARGLQCAHTAGVIHRDLKPANILLHQSPHDSSNSASLEPKITDFGLARRLDDPTGLTHTGAVLGTPAYMSPEQADGNWDSVGPASDQFSLGVVLYEMLTGQRPYKVHLGELNKRAFQTPPMPPSRVRPSAAPMPDAIVCRTLAKEPAERFPSVGQLADELESWLNTPQPTKRRRLAMVAGVALAVIVLATTLTLLLFGKRTDTKNPAPDSIGMEFVRIEPGSFVMGARFGGWDNERPTHEVEITRPFYLARTEVTVGQFKRFVAETGYKTVAEYPEYAGSGFDPERQTVVTLWSLKLSFLNPGFRVDTKFTWRNPGFAQTDDHPVVLVSWEDAKAFCEWLSRVEGRHFRLPTEAEWEYACRAGTTTRYWWGDDEDGAEGKANIADQSLVSKFPEVTWARTWNDGFPFTAPVGSFALNAWGLSDISGNAAEWCEDWFAPYTAEKQRDPTGPPTGTDRIVRGGFWNGGPDVVRSSDRAFLPPKTSLCYVGFRVAADVKE
jgi:formylglycine-generating enzyme required for sulfatase activity